MNKDQSRPSVVSPEHQSALRAETLIPQTELSARKPATRSPDYRAAGLLNSIRSMTHPDFHSLNRHCGRNDRLLHAVLCAYAKHHLDCAEIGWGELGDILMNVICNEIGDEAFIAWGEMISGRMT